MLQNRLGTRTKTSQTRIFCVFAVYLPLYQAVNFPKMIDGISLRFRFDRPFERPFRNQFSELAPGPQHSVQKIPSNGMQNLPNKIDSSRTGEYSNSRASVLFVWEHSTHDRVRGNFPVPWHKKVVKIKENVQCRVVLIQTDKEKMSETNESTGFHKVQWNNETSGENNLA